MGRGGDSPGAQFGLENPPGPNAQQHQVIQAAREKRRRRDIEISTQNCTGRAKGYALWIWKLTQDTSKAQDSVTWCPVAPKP
jgi:hypothetical protein